MRIDPASGIITVNGAPRALFDHGIERLFVAAGIHDPAKLADTTVGTQDIHCPHAREAYAARANLLARGEQVTMGAVLDEIQRYREEHEQSSGPHELAWFDKHIASLPERTDPPIAGWEHTILRFAERRRQAEDAWEKEEREIDRSALDDLDQEGAPPVVDPLAGPQPGTFEHDRTVALEDVRRALGSVDQVSREPLFVDARDLFTCDYPEQPWAVQGLIARFGLALLGAGPKSAKTWIAVAISVAIATGTRVFGEFNTTSGTVAYFFAEDLKRQVRNRVRAALASLGLGADALGDRLHVCPRGKYLDITSDEDLAWILASARRLGPIDLLVLDPLRDVHSGEEDHSDSMSDVMRRLRLLGDLLHCTVLVTHI